jgi:PPM family protein phosphatase
MSSLALECAARNDIGRRANNEDAVFVSSKLAAVADGVGGAAAGEVASQRIVESLALLDKSRLDIPLDAALEGAIAWGNESIGFIAGCRPQLAGMSTTLTAVALGDDGYAVANVGDSRAYLLRDGALRPLTRDDSLVQRMLDAGTITADEARRHPQRSFVVETLDGDPQRTPPPVTTLQAQPGDRLLLCSDGLTDFVDEPPIAAALRIADRGECAQRLVDLALAAGARDNVSVVVADVVARGGPSAWA